MKCVNHPDRDAVAQCQSCKDLLCESCTVVFKDGRTLCAECFYKNHRPHNNATSSPIEKAPLKETSNLVYRDKLPVKSATPQRKAGVGTWALLILSAVLLIAGLDKMYNEEDKPPWKTEQEYISSCKTFDYENLLRNPDGYSGEPAVFSGEVVQVVEGFLNNVQLRLNIGDDRVIYISYVMKDGEYRYLEGDTITVYGELTGLMTYTAVLGNQVSIPSLSAKYIKQ